MPESRPLLDISELTVRFGAISALDALDLSVERGELFVLLGGSGSGKTTLLRAIAGFVQPDAGHIALDGTDIGPLPPHRRPVNTMFQSYALFPHMSVAANIRFGLHQLGLGRSDAARRVDEMLDLVRLPGFGARRPHQLSGGQQQRVALARSLAPRPLLLLLDEPLSALDRNLREQTRQELMALQRRLGITFILVTHDQEEALSTATRIGVMEHGRLAQVGRPDEVYERPRTRFVAEFLGAANVLPATVRGNSADLTWIELPGLDGTVCISGGAARAGEQVLLAIRPERIRIEDSHAPNRLNGTVADSSYSGERVTYSIRLSNGAVVRATRALADGRSAAPAAPGDRVTLSWQPDAGILLTR